LQKISLNVIISIATTSNEWGVSDGLHSKEVRPQVHTVPDQGARIHGNTPVVDVRSMPRRLRLNGQTVEVGRGYQDHSLSVS